MKVIASAFATLFSSTLLATTLHDLSVNGEAAFDYNLLSSADGPQSLGGARDNQYRFNLAQLTVRKDIEKIYIMSRLTYTPTTYRVNSSDSSTESIGVLRQLEVYYKAAPKLHLGFGRFLTTFGFESPMRHLNVAYNYSIARQTLYPIYAEGVRAKYVIDEKFTFIVSNYNRLPDATYGDDNPSSKATEVAVIASLGNLNMYGGYITSRDEQLNERVNNKGLSFWASYLINEFSFIATYDNRSSQTKGDRTRFAQSISGTMNYKFDKNNIYCRMEVVSGAKNIQLINGYADYKDANQVLSLTVGDKLAVSDNIFMYAEFRSDKSDEKAFETKGGSLSKNVSLFTLGAIFHF